MGISNVARDNDQDDPNNEEANPGGMSVEGFFAASVVLITGVTGFLGKALLEKLLRACPRIGTIYVFMRPKKNKSIEERFRQLVDNPVFDRIRHDCPSLFNKVIPIYGDVSQDKLGLSQGDWLILTQRVNIVFHSAATVRFDEPLKIAVNLNTRGTERMIELCSNMANLVSFVHVSTAYSNADQVDIIKETVYSTNVEAEIVIDMCENLDDETLSVLEGKLRGRHPNTYTLTKKLAENIILTKGKGLPISIVRPSIVCAAREEPFPGWLDNVWGITGIMMEIGRGTIRSIVCNENLIVDLIPVDYVVDTLICSAWHSTAIHSTSNNNDTVQIYNCVSGTLNPIKWREFGNMTKKHAIELPSKYVLWYPGFKFRTNKIIHHIVVALCHYLPALIFDLALKLQGAKPIMLNVTKRFERAARTGEFFAVNQWNFQGENMRQLSENVKTATDSNHFNIDITTIDWDAYVYKYILGIRNYILKDNPDSLTKARKRLFKLYWIHRLAQALFTFALVAMFARIVSSFLFAA